MTADSNFNDLCSELQPLAKAFLFQCNKLFDTKIIVTWRDPLAQNACKAKGLSNASAGKSPHNCTLSDGTPGSKAFDFAIYLNGTYITNGTDPRYTQAGAIWKALGQKWGGDFIHPDYDHCELANWQETTL